MVPLTVKYPLPPPLSSNEYCVMLSPLGFAIEKKVDADTA